jgi:proline iminopeptidase
MHVRDLGQGPPVLLLHPGPGLDGSVFEPGVQRLVDAGYRAILADLPGSGHSPDPPEWTITAMAQAVEDLAAELGLSDWTLLGHSFGGFVALQHLVVFPGSAARLIASCTVASETPPPGAPEDPLADLPEDVAARVRAAFEREATVQTPEECRQVWLDQMPLFAADVDRASAMLEHVHFRPEAHHPRDWGELEALGALAQTDIPVLAVAGEKDRDTTPVFAEQIASTAHHGELAVIPGAGHFPFAEAPELYWDRVAGWLRSVDG